MTLVDVGAMILLSVVGFAYVALAAMWIEND